MSDLINRQEFTPVLCVTGGDGYEEGKVYPMMGWNNGVHILRTNEFGDVIDREFCTGGYGKGLFNSFTNEGYPSFDELPSAQPERKTGRWIDVNGNGSLYECDQCHEMSCCKGKFCMECGAKMDGKKFEEPTINPCRGCEDYDGYGGCKSNGGCGRTETEGAER